MIKPIKHYLSISGKSVKRSAIREIETGVQPLAQVINDELINK